MSGTLRMWRQFVVCLTISAHALSSDSSADGPRVSKREQRQVARLQKEYQRARTDELKASIVDKAIELGPAFTVGIKEQIEAEGHGGLRVYKKQFLATIDRSPHITPDAIASTDKQLKEARARLLLLRSWIAKLDGRAADAGIPDVGDDVDEGADQDLRSLEESYIKGWLRDRGYGRLTTVERALIQAVNQFREKKGMTKLEVDYRLCAASRDHSLDMTREKFFSHKSELRNKLTYVHRAIRYGTTAIGENIASGPDPAVAFNLWKASSGHERQMLHPHATRVGAGVFGRKYTMMFGAAEQKMPDVGEDASAEAGF